MTEPTTGTISETTTETTIQDMPSLSVVVEEGDGNGYKSFSVRLEFADMPETATLPQLVGEIMKQAFDARGANEP